MESELNYAHGCDTCSQLVKVVQANWADVVGGTGILLFYCRLQ